MEHSQDGGKAPPPRMPWPFGWSGRQFGFACLFFGCAVLVADSAALLVLRRYWAGLFLLAPPITLAGVALLALPDRLTATTEKSLVAGAALAAALVVGFAIGGLLAWDPVAVLRWLGLQ
jgi:hypothetical protein